MLVAIALSYLIGLLPKTFSKGVLAMSEHSPSTAASVPPQVAMLQMISGFWISRAIYIVAKLGLADHMQGGAKTADELATASNTHAPSLFRVLRALVSVGVLTQSDDNRFGLTPLSETLRSDVPGSLRAFATVELGDDHYEGWGNLLHSVKTGDIAFDSLMGMSAWEYYAQNAENGKNFNDAMTGMSQGTIDAVMASYDFTGITKLADIGGGHGALLASILKANPSMQGILFDAPNVVPGAQERMKAEGLSDRCEIVGGDFFASVPSGADAHIMKWIIHDWDEDKCQTILTHCHQALPVNGKLILIEAVVPSTNEPHFSKFIDLNMLVMTGGRERTGEEYGELLAKAGFKLTRIVPTASPMSVVEAVRL
jgi:O-methyltransferase domain/Dimerisation domain